MAQIQSLEKVGADIVRVSVPTMDAAEAFKQIKQRVNIRSLLIYILITGLLYRWGVWC